MPTLAPKLPYTHPFAGGYPRLGGQPLPTDPDAIDYLNRVAAADGAAVEVGVAMAVDDFFKGLKADGTFSAIKAACIMCGARTISGALVPLAGAAPTGYGDWASGDYDRSSGLKGNGSTKYLDSNRANNADGQNDNHNAVYVATAQSGGVSGAYIGSNVANVGDNNIGRSGAAPASLFVRNRTQTGNTVAKGDATGFVGHARASAASFSVRAKDGTSSISQSSEQPSSDSVLVFALPATAFTDARLTFYSIGSALDLAALDNRVSTLVAAIAAAI